MPTATLSSSLTTLRSPSNLLCPCKQGGRHPDGLPRQSCANATWPSACYRADRLGNPRWGLDYVITTIGQSWEMVTEQTNIISEERQFLPALKDWVSLPSKL